MKTQKPIRRSIKIAQTQIGKSFRLRASKKQNHESHPFKCIKSPIRNSIRYISDQLSSHVNTSIDQSIKKQKIRKLTWKLEEECWRQAPLTHCDSSHDDRLLGMGRRRRVLEKKVKRLDEKQLVALCKWCWCGAYCVSMCIYVW